MNINPPLYKNDTIYRTIGSDSTKGSLACGFMNSLEYTKDKMNSISHISHRYSGFLVLSGKGEYIDVNGNKTPIYQGCFVQRVPDVFHNTIIDKGSNWLEFFINISRDSFFTLCSMGIFDSNRPVLYPGLTSYTLNRLISFHSEMKRALDHELSNLLFEAFAIISDIYKMDKSNAMNKNEEALIEAACTLLSSPNYFHEKIENISKKLNVGYEYFRKTFKKNMSISPRQYQIIKRVDYAKKLLSDGKHSIKVVATESGYPDIFSFSKQFKRLTGTSPQSFASKALSK